MADLVKLSVLALGASLIFAAPVAAQDEAEEPAQVAEEENPNERICRRVRTTGSNLRQRICMSRSEWTSLREQSREELERAQQDDLMNQGSSVGD